MLVQIQIQNLVNWNCLWSWQCEKSRALISGTLRPRVWWWHFNSAKHPLLHLLTLLLLASLWVDWPIRSILSQTAQPISKMSEVMTWTFMTGGWQKAKQTWEPISGKEVDGTESWLVCCESVGGFVMPLYQTRVKWGNFHTKSMTSQQVLWIGENPKHDSNLFSPNFNHLPLMGTLHREDKREEEEKRRQSLSNRFSFSLALLTHLARFNQKPSYMCCCS